MAKILILAVIAWLIYLIIKNYARSVEHSKESTQRQPEKMVQCSHCGLHLPENDSVKSGDHHYCCETHAQQATHDH